MWTSSLLPDCFARAFAEPPDLKLWQWADLHVWLENKAAAEPGLYRSAKTPWTRRIQELIQDPFMFVYDFTVGRWRRVPVQEINVMKSSQSGFTEAVLNGIRYKASYRPCNVIYTVDTRETARDISERLRPSLEKLDGGNIFTGDDDDVGTFVMRLLSMDIWFQGSFSMGKFASKMAPLVISDESEEQGEDRTDTSNNRALASRKKTADHGLQINLCKPKRRNGPIHKGHKRGNQEAQYITCPHCSYHQPVTFFRNEDLPEPVTTPFSEELVEIRDEVTGQLITRLPIPLEAGASRPIRTGRLVFDHCKDLLGKWDKLRILTDTYYECASCRARIDEDQKALLASHATWLPTAIGTPGIVSQGVSDLLSTDANSSWGQIVLDYLSAKAEGRKELQGFYNHRLGLPWSDEVNKTNEAVIRANIAGKSLWRVDEPAGEGPPRIHIFEHRLPAEKKCVELQARGLQSIVPVLSTCPPYKRGTIPFIPAYMVLGSDVGGAYAKWALGAVLPNQVDIAIIDWGHEIDPSSVSDVLLYTRWPCLEDGKERTVRAGFIDGKHRKTDVYKACIATRGQLSPATGEGGASARSKRLFAWANVQGFPGLGRLDFNDREAKDEFYIDRLARKIRRCFFPIDVEDDPEFVSELCAEELIEDENGRIKWKEFPGANHYGDCVKLLITGFRFLTRHFPKKPRQS